MVPLAATLLTGLLLAPATAGDGADATVDFNRDIRPLLTRHCYLCHGPDVSTRKAGLRLDRRDDALAGRRAGAPIVPGDAAASLLLQRVASNDDDVRMPPDGRPRLAPSEVDLLRRWIDEGAAYRESWAWTPIHDVEPPVVEGAGDHPVDRFVAARLRERGLDSAGRADRRALIRRLSFDLTGLPPAPDEVENFVADASDDAWERLVDRLLESPRYGERWARHWLDLVRYAETHGHEFDYPIRHAWQYRDYVIRALNADVPYDQFVTEHVAGDLLPTPRRHPTEGYDESIIGTGFWYLSQGTHAPVDVRGDEAERVANQIDVLGKAFLGVTVSCARCHDHKFDPISTDDFYALAGFLQSSRRQEAYLDPNGRIERRTQDVERLLASAETTALDLGPMPTTGLDRYAQAAAEARGRIPAPPKTKNDNERRAAQETAEAALEKAIDDVAIARDLDREVLERWARALPDRPAAPPAAAPETTAFETFDSYDDWFATGHAFGRAPTGPRQLAAGAAAAQLVPPGVAHSGRRGPRLQGTLRSATFELPSEAIVYRVSGRGGRVRLIIDGFYLDEYNALLFEGMIFDVNTPGEGWVEHRQSVGLYAGHRAYIEIIDDGNGFVAVDEIRLVDGGAAPDAKPAPAPAALDDVATAIERWRAGTITPDEAATVNWLLRHDLVALGAPDTPGARTLRRQLEQAARIDGETPAPMRVLAIADGTGEDERVFVRGNHRTPGDVVPRRFIDSLAGAQPAIAGGSGRLELAERMLAPDNPLPARVMINRVWHHLFGEGLVPTPDDFGGLGRPPSHPEMLDWLATWFRDDADWSLKQLIRLIVTSETYRRASTLPDAPGARAAQVDPTNQLLARARVRRLEAEAIRDAVLVVSGRLDPTMYGPPVPVELTPFMTGRGRPGTSGPRDGAGRRSVYIAVRRNFRAPMMTVFDAPVPSSTIGRRTRSNVPAQALMMMNDPFVSEHAVYWAERTLARPGAAPADRVTFMYEQAYARPPTADEMAAALGFLEHEAAGRPPVDVWTDFAHVLLNTKEFMFLR